MPWWDKAECRLSDSSGSMMAKSFFYGGHKDEGTQMQNTDTRTEDKQVFFFKEAGMCVERNVIMCSRVGILTLVHRVRVACTASAP